MEDDGPPPGEEEEYVDALGVIAALERTCELEARLRQAIQDTHPLTTTLDWDFNAADREREGLLAISEQLEYLEDKLREYRFLEPAELDNKAVLLGQLDGVRRELVEVVARWGPHIMFGKELVREVLAFAQVSEEDGAPEDEEPSGGSGSAGSSDLPGGAATAHEPSDVELLQAARRLRHQGSGGSGSLGGFASEFEPEEEMEPRAAAVPGVRRSTGDLYGSQGLGGEQGGALIPAVRRSMPAGLARPPRYPAAGGKEQQAQFGNKQRLAGPTAASPKHQGTAQLGATTSPPSLHEQHLLAAQQASPPSRSAFLQHQQEPSSLAHQRGYVQPSQVPRSAWEEEREGQLEAAAVPGATSPGAAATVSALRTATAAARGASGRRQLDVEGAAGADGYAQAAGLVSYPPSSYAPSEGAPSSRQSPYSARGGAPLGGGPSAGPAARPSSSLLSKLNRVQQGGYADSASRYTGYSRLKDEDIYGALDDGPGGRPTSLRPASIINPSPRQYGGYVRIRDRLSQAEAAAKTPEVQEQRREPMPPRIYGEQDSEEIQPASYAASPAPSRERRSGRMGIIVDDPPALQPSPPRSERLALAYSSGGAGVSGRPAFSETRGATSRDADREGRRGGGLGRLLGGAARLLLTGAAAAAVAVAAHKAGPVVLQKGQQAAARLAEEQHRLAERWQERQQRKREQASAQAQRKREQQAAAAAQQQRQARAAGGSKGMADLPPRPGSGFRGLADAPPHMRTGAGRPVDLPPQPKAGDTPPWERSQAATAKAALAAAAKQQPQQQPQRQQPSQGRPARASGAYADPLPPHLAAAARNGGVPVRVPPVAQVHPPPHGMLFPAMPPPDVSASMG